MSDNDVLKTIAMRKYYLQQSHDIVQKSLPKVNSEVKEISEVMHRIEKQAANEINLTVLMNINQTYSDFSSRNSNSSRSDENEVANGGCQSCPTQYFVSRHFFTFGQRQLTTLHK